MTRHHTHDDMNHEPPPLPHPCMQFVDPVCSAAKGHVPCKAAFLTDKLKGLISQLPANQTVIAFGATAGQYGGPGYKIMTEHAAAGPAPPQQEGSGSLLLWVLPVGIGGMAGGSSHHGSEQIDLMQWTASTDITPLFVWPSPVLPVHQVQLISSRITARPDQHWGHLPDPVQ